MTTNLTDFAVPTAIAEPGMTVRQLFAACIEADVPGIPYRAASGEITGKASVRNILKAVCIPQFMVDNAALLGDRIEALRFPLIEEERLLDQTIDDFILADAPQIGPASPIAKALAIMEAHDTTYLFVIDARHNYHGTVTICHVADRILKRNPA